MNVLVEGHMCPSRETVSCLIHPGRVSPSLSDLDELHRRRKHASVDEDKPTSEFALVIRTWDKKRVVCPFALLCLAHKAIQRIFLLALNARLLDEHNHRLCTMCDGVYGTFLSNRSLVADEKVLEALDGFSPLALSMMLDA